MLRAAAVRQLSDTISAGNNDDAESDWSYPITSLGSAAAVCLVIISFCGFAGWLYRRCGWARRCGVESNTPPRQTQSERHQMLEDERLAMQLRQEMEDERKLQTVKQMRNARRHKYKQFLAPYTLVSENRRSNERAEMMRTRMRMRTRRLNRDCGNSNMLVSGRQIGGCHLFQRGTVSTQNGTRRNMMPCHAMQCNETKCLDRYTLLTTTSSSSSFLSPPTDCS